MKYKHGSVSYWYSINRDLKAGFVYMTGYVDADQIVSAGHAMYRSPEWRPHYNSLWDFRPSRAVDITEEGFGKVVRQKLNRDKEAESEEKIALVVDRDSLISIATLVEVKVSTAYRQIKFFDQEKKAREWLGLPQEADIGGWLEDKE